MSTKRKTIKVEVEIEFEYNPEHYALAGMGEEYADAIAKDMALCNASQSIEEGVQLIHVCNREKCEWWYIRPKTT